MNDFDFGDVDFGTTDFGDVDFQEKVPPPIDKNLHDQAVYPEAARSPLFLDWSPMEEDLQLAALGWLMLWRKSNTIRFEGRKIVWTLPPEDLTLWRVLEERMTDWAFLEKGDLDLEATHTMLVKRHRIRAAITLERPTPNQPASAGLPRKETSHVGQPQQSHPYRQPGQRPGTQNDPQRHGAVPLLGGHD